MPDEAAELRELVEDLRARVAALEERTAPEPEPDPLVLGTALFRDSSRVKRKVTKGV